MLAACGLPDTVPAPLAAAAMTLLDKLLGPYDLSTSSNKAAASRKDPCALSSERK